MRRAIISGASRGIGAAIARALAADGVRVVLGYRERLDDASAVADSIREAGGVACIAQFDVANAESVTNALTELGYNKDPFNIVVNNAAILRDSLFPAMPRSDWKLVLDTVLDGFFNLTQPLVIPMVRRRWGRIINIVSPSGLVGNRGQVNYAAAKGGLVAATKSLAREVAGRGVTVNAVCPGLIQTDMLASFDSEPMQKGIALGRVGEPHEVAGAVRFLASDSPSYITGTVLRVDGGLSL